MSPTGKETTQGRALWEPILEKLTKMLQRLAGAHKQESCRHTRTGLTAAALTVPHWGAKACVTHAPRPLEQGQRLSSLPWSVAGHARARLALLLGDPLVENFSPNADGNHIPFKVALLSPFTSLAGIQLPRHFQFLHSSNLRAALL